MEIRFSDYKSYDGRVSESEFNALVDLMQRVTLCNGVGYTLSRNVTGTIIQTKPGTGGSSLIQCPFDATVTTDPTTKNTTVTVRPGTVNQLLPDNINEPFTVDISNDIKIKVKALTDGTQVTSCTLSVDDDDADTQTPTPFALPTSYEIVTGVIIDGKYYRTIPCGSIQLVGFQEYILDKDPPADPGQLQYTPYYKWVIQ